MLSYCVTGTCTMLYGGNWDGCIDICDGWWGWVKFGKLFGLYSWVGLLSFVFDRAIELVASSYTCDNLSALWFGVCWLMFKL